MKKQTAQPKINAKATRETNPEKGKKNRELFLSLLVILAAVVAAYSPVFHNGFLNWDDDKLVTKAEQIKDLSWQGALGMFSSFHYFMYHPLVTLSYAIEFHFVQLNPFVYHATNLLLHCITTSLVLWLVFRLSENVTLAFITAMLFGIHPLHVESVAWITERKDVLYAMFYVAGLISYVKYAKKETFGKFCYLTLFFFLCSCLSKAMAVTFPVVLFAVDYFLERPFNKKNVMEKIPFFLLALIIGIVNIFAQYGLSIHGNKDLLTFAWYDRMFFPFYSFLFYLWKAVVPFNLSCFYPFPEKTGGFLPVVYMVSPFIVALLIAGVFLVKQHKRAVVFGSIFFCIAILPALQIARVGIAITADRFFYVSSIGLFFIIGYTVAATFRKMQSPAKYMLGVFWGCIFLFLGITTYTRCGVWKDDITLFSDVSSQFPNESIAYDIMAKGYEQRGEREKAISSYKKAIEVDSLDGEAYTNLGLLYYYQGTLDSGFNYYSRAVVDDVNYMETNYPQGVSTSTIHPGAEDTRGVKASKNIGLAFFIKKNYDKSIEWYQKAILLNPHSPDIYNNLGLCFSGKGDYDKAIEAYKQAIAQKPDYALAYKNLGVAYSQKKETVKAFAAYTQAARLGDTDVQTWLKQIGYSWQ